MHTNPKVDKRSKKERDRRKEKFLKHVFDRNEAKAIEQMILNGMSMPMNEPKRPAIVHSDFFNDFEDDFDDETI